MSDLSYVQQSILGCRKVQKGAWFIILKGYNLGIFECLC